MVVNLTDVTEIVIEIALRLVVFVESAPWTVVVLVTVESFGVEVLVTVLVVPSLSVEVAAFG